MKGIVITASDKLSVREFSEPLYKTIGAVVGGYIEVVHPRGLKAPYCMIVNEEGLLKRLPLNAAGSAWYGTMDHGHPIVGDIVIMKESEGEDGIDLAGLTDEEIVEIKRVVGRMFGGNIVEEV